MHRDIIVTMDIDIIVTMHIAYFDMSCDSTYVGLYTLSMYISHKYELNR